MIDMFEAFLTKFSITSESHRDKDEDLLTGVPFELSELFRLMGGSTFDNGLYRMHTFKSSIKWSIQLGNYFPLYKNQILPFGYDWLSRQFCIDKSNQVIYLFDPATVEDFKLEKSLSAFHNEDVVDDLFAIDLFKSVCTYCGLKTIDYDDCLGYKIPLFLSGKDSVENHEKQNIEVYWHLTTQLYEQVKDLPDGTRIGNIKIE
jgi:hypothetical protein